MVSIDLVQFEREAEAFSQSISREFYLQHAGLKDDLNLEVVFDRFGHLFTVECFAALADAELEPKYRRFLQEFVASYFIERQVRRLTEQLALAEATATLEWEGQQVSYRAAPVRWANLGARDRRRALYERWLEVTARLNALRQERHQASLALAPELDFADYVQLWDGLRCLHLERLSQQAEWLLAETREMYLDELPTHLRHAGAGAGDAWKVDLAWVFRAPQFDAVFRADRLLPALHRTLLDLGIRLEDQTNITLDTDFRAKKSPRAFCAALEVPDDIRLVIMPSGGRSDYEALLHEAGHAEHFGTVDRTQRFAYRWLGDTSVTEAYAFLLEYLTTDAAWLARHLELAAPTDYLRLSLFHKLYMLRRYSAKVLYEQELHRAASPTIEQWYAEFFTHHLGVRYFEQEYLADVDDAFYSAQYLRAWMLEAQLRHYLKREYDEEWFRAPKAGRFLIDLWREGQKYTAEELAGYMGFDGLDPAPLVEEIRAALPG